MASYNKFTENTMHDFFQWMLINWQDVCKWAGGFYLIFQLGKVFATAVNQIATIIKRTQTAEDMLGRVDATVDRLSTNHLPHIQSELEKTNSSLQQISETMSGLREDIRMVVFQRIAGHE